MGAENVRITDLAPALYLNTESKRTIKERGQIEEDLWTWWAEADLKPSPIRLLIEDDHLNDKYHNDLVLQAKAAGVIRKGRVEADRVEAEIRGVERLRDLILSSKAKNGVVYLSPPGSKEEGFGAEGRRRLSFTYLYHVGNAGRIHFLAVPELEVPALEHFAGVEELIDEEVTLELVGLREGEVNDRSLVAYPFLCKDEKSLDSIAQKLGYRDLRDLWKVALEAKRLRGRVGELIKYASQEIWDARIVKDTEKLGVLGDVFRGVVALLVTNGLEDIKEITKYFDNKVDAILGSKEIDRLGGVSPVLYEPYMVDIQEFYARLQNNKRAMGIMEGGSCPGDRGLGFEGDLWRTQDLAVNNNVMGDVLGFEQLEGTKHEESYAFDHEGQCVVCKVDPKKLGPCNICEACDHNLRQQAS